jgi:hypothetical protein
MRKISCIFLVIILLLYRFDLPVFLWSPDFDTDASETWVVECPDAYVPSRIIVPELIELIEPVNDNTGFEYEFGDTVVLFIGYGYSIIVVKEELWNGYTERQQKKRRTYRLNNIRTCLRNGKMRKSQL